MNDTTRTDAYRRIVGPERAEWTKRILRQYDEGLSMRTIAAATGRSYGFVNRLLREGGAVLRPRGGPRPRRNHPTPR